MAEVVLENVSYTYPGESEPTLSALNLTIEHGTAHALLGASGAGKTTMLNLLSGLLHPTGGRILFDGIDVSMGMPGHAMLLWYSSFLCCTNQSPSSTT